MLPAARFSRPSSFRGRVGSARHRRSADFFDALPAFDAFDGVVDAANYHPLPDGWALAVADVADSTGAIRAGRYKEVNLAGAAVIRAIQNAAGSHELPYVFGGDGALVALAPGEQETPERRSPSCARGAPSDSDSSCAARCVPVADIRAAGHDVRAARFRVSGEAAYAMFSGGGANWADREMKAGRFLVPPAPSGAQPDLTGLSCRFLPMRARNGAILSIIAVPRSDADPAAFGALVANLIELLATQDRGGHPVPVGGPHAKWPPPSLALEARAQAPPRRRMRAARGPSRNAAFRSYPTAPGGRSAGSMRASTTPMPA